MARCSSGRAIAAALQSCVDANSGRCSASHGYTLFYVSHARISTAEGAFYAAWGAPPAWSVVAPPGARAAGLTGPTVHSATPPRCAPPQVSAALFEPPPFQPAKLTVTFMGEGARAAGTPSAGSSLPPSRRYTLTHNDITGALRLSIGPEFNASQVQGLYTRILRDEITAEWVFAHTAHSWPELHVFCHVSGEERWLAPPALRNFIFRREMSLVLDTFAYADRALLDAHPALRSARVYVHFQSDVQDLDLREYWGVLGERRSWRRMPTGVLARLRLLLFGFPPALPRARLGDEGRSSASAPSGGQQQPEMMMSAGAAAVTAGSTPQGAPSGHSSRDSDVVVVAAAQPLSLQSNSSCSSSSSSGGGAVVAASAPADATRPLALSMQSELQRLAVAAAGQQQQQQGSSGQQQQQQQQGRSDLTPVVATTTATAGMAARESFADAILQQLSDTVPAAAGAAGCQQQMATATAAEADGWQEVARWFLSEPQLLPQQSQWGSQQQQQQQQATSDGSAAAPTDACCWPYDAPPTTAAQQQLPGSSSSLQQPPPQQQQQPQPQQGTFGNQVGLRPAVAVAAVSSARGAGRRSPAGTVVPPR
jgi:Staygreen protein